MRGLLLAAALLACRTPAPPGAVVASPVPGRSDVLVESSRVFAGGTLAEVVVSAPSGIFQLDLDFSKGRPAKLTLLVLRERHCEGLSFRPLGGEWRGIRGTPGVKVRPGRDGLAVELGPEALAGMGQGGRLQFVNLYR